MRRGLIAWSKTELPERVFDARLERLRAGMAQEGLDALVVYTNNTRTAAVSWLTAFVPYWAEGLLTVPKSGDPLLSMAFSNRVVGWGKSVSHVARFEGVPRVGLGAGKYLAELAARRVGVADLEGLRLAVADDLAETATGATLIDATSLFERVRARPDPAEIALAAQAGAIAREALDQATGREAALADMLAAIESHARLAGAEELYLAAASDLDRDQRFRRIEGAPALGRRFAVRATVAYKGSWTRMTRTLARERTDAAIETRASEVFAAAVALLPDARGFAGFASWSIEACRLAQPLEVVMGSAVEAPRPLAAGALATAQAVVDIDGRKVAIAAPLLNGGDGFPASLLVSPTFARH